MASRNSPLKPASIRRRLVFPAVNIDLVFGIFVLRKSLYLIVVVYPGTTDVSLIDEVGAVNLLKMSYLSLRRRGSCCGEWLAYTDDGYPHKPRKQIFGTTGWDRKGRVPSCLPSQPARACLPKSDGNLPSRCWRSTGEFSIVPESRSDLRQLSFRPTKQRELRWVCRRSRQVRACSVRSKTVPKVLSPSKGILPRFSADVLAFVRFRRASLAYQPLVDSLERDPLCLLGSLSRE